MAVSVTGPHAVNELGGPVIPGSKRAYFALQGAGFNNTVTDVDALSYMEGGDTSYLNLRYQLN